MTQSSHDAELDVDILMEHISRSKRHVLNMTKQFFEDSVNFETPFNEDVKLSLKENLIEFMKVENQLKLQQEASNQLQYNLHNINQDDATSAEPIESIIESANLNEKFNQQFQQLQANNNYDPFEDDCFKNLLKLLGEDNRENANEDFEMIETEFTVPIDPFSKMEINIPVRNKTCNHIYDKEQFTKIFEQRPRNSSIKCPITGCPNKKVTINDVVEDPRLQILIDNHKRQES